MLCEKCKKNYATLFYEENINGQKRSYVLCSDCADKLKKSGELPETNIFAEEFDTSLSSFHNSLFEGLFGAPHTIEPTKSKRCPVCSSSFEDFRARGKAGCASCYSVFEKELDSSIRQIHGNARHIGRVPSKFKEKNAKENTLKDLRNKLKEAIEKEEYEKAVTLRDEIRSLENQK